jgi:hypothetical protein
MLRVLTEPRWWLAARPYVLPERQSALVAALNGGRDGHLFLFPAMAALLWLVLAPVAWLGSDRRWITATAGLFLALMAVWGWWLAAIPL